VKYLLMIYGNQEKWESMDLRCIETIQGEARSTCTTRSGDRPGWRVPSPAAGSRDAAGLDQTACSTSPP
jgi:hypothetical protein